MASDRTPIVRTVSLAAIGKTVTLAAYVRAVKLAKANPDVEFQCGLDCWWPCTGAEVVRQFRRGMEDRINQGVPYVERGIAPSR